MNLEHGGQRRVSLVQKTRIRERSSETQVNDGLPQYGVPDQRCFIKPIEAFLESEATERRFNALWTSN